RARWARGRVAGGGFLRFGAERRAARRGPPRADRSEPATGTRSLLAPRRRQAQAVWADGAADRERPDHRHRRFPGSLAVRPMRPALRAHRAALTSFSRAQVSI